MIFSFDRTICDLNHITYPHFIIYYIMRLPMGMIRGVIQWSSKISGGVFLVMLYAAASLAVTNDLSLAPDTIVQTIHQTNAG